MSNNKGLPVSIVINGSVLQFAGFGNFPPQYAGVKEFNPRAAVYKSPDGSAWTHAGAKDFRTRDVQYDTYPEGGGIDVGFFYQPNVDARGGITVVEWNNGQPIRILATIEVGGEEGNTIANHIASLLNQETQAQVGMI